MRPSCTLILMAILITGGASFIGSNFIHAWFGASDEPIINLDRLTYAGNMQNLAGLPSSASQRFVHGDIGDRALVDGLLATHEIRAVVNFAADSHVDRSIHGPEDFISGHLPRARG